MIFTICYNLGVSNLFVVLHAANAMHPKLPLAFCAQISNHIGLNGLRAFMFDATFTAKRILTGFTAISLAAPCVCAEIICAFLNVAFRTFAAAIQLFEGLWCLCAFACLPILCCSVCIGWVLKFGGWMFVGLRSKGLVSVFVCGPKV